MAALTFAWAAITIFVLKVISGPPKPNMAADPRLNRIKLYTYLIINFIKLQYLRIDTIKFPQFIL